MSESLRYVKEFDFTPQGFARGGHVKCNAAKGGKIKNESKVTTGVSTKRKPNEVQVSRAASKATRSEVNLPKNAPVQLPPFNREPLIPMAAQEPVMKKGGKFEAKVGKVMHEFKSGELRSGGKKGPEVKSRKQAVAIALSEARKAGKK